MDDKMSKREKIIAIAVLFVISFIVITILSNRDDKTFYDKNGYFRGIKWGCTYNELSLKINDLTGHHLEKKGFYGIEYIDDFDYTGLKAEVEYGMEDNKLSSVSVKFDRFGEYGIDGLFNLMSDRLTKKYGNKIRNEEEWYDDCYITVDTWILKNSTVKLVGGDKKNKNYISIYFVSANN